jgi:hypothetical protein
MKKLLLLWITTSVLFANSISNSEEYRAETLAQEVTVVTTEKGFVIIGNEMKDLIFTLDPVKRAILRGIIEAYQEVDNTAEYANYRTNLPPAMQSTDFKRMQFVYTHIVEDASSNIAVTIDMDANGIHKEPFVIRATIDQWLNILNIVDQGFLYMDKVKTEILKLRSMENDISRG